MRTVWDALVAAAVPPNAVTLSQLAHGLCKGAKDVPSTLAALRECASRGAAVDAYVLNILLNACLRELLNAGPDASSDVKAVVRESALAVWEAGKGIHNERTLTSTIKVLADAGDAGGAVRTFRAAWEDETPLDVDALATALRIFAVTEPAAVLIGVMNMAQEQRGLEPNTMCANIVLAACSKDGEFSTALTLWRHMLERRTPPPDKASLASVILACGRAGRVDLALDAFEEGKNKGVECDTVTVNVLLEACAKSDAPPGEALGILMDAIESRIPVDALTISSLLTAYYSSQTPTSLANTPARSTRPLPSSSSAVSCRLNPRRGSQMRCFAFASPRVIYRGRRGRSRRPSRHRGTINLPRWTNDPSGFSWTATRRLGTWPAQRECSAMRSV